MPSGVRCAIRLESTEPNTQAWYVAYSLGSSTTRAGLPSPIIDLLQSTLQLGDVEISWAPSFPVTAIAAGPAAAPRPAAPCCLALGGGTRHPDTSAGRPGRAKSESCHAESPGHCDRTCMFVPPLCRFASLIAHMIDIGIWYSVWAVQCDRFSLLGRSHLMFRFTKGTKSPTVPLDKFCTYT